MCKCHAKLKEMLGIQLITTISIKDILSSYIIISVLTGIFTTQPILKGILHPAAETHTNIIRIFV